MKGSPVFYLNLEDFHSTPLLLKCTGKGLSNVLYYLKENSRSLSLKLEGIKSVDPLYNIHFFSPPDNAAEMDEIQPGEASSLLKHFRDEGLYELVVIDMSCSLSRRNIALLDACDRILLVTGQDHMPRHKTRILLSDLRLLDASQQHNLLQKTILVLNRCSREFFLDTEDSNTYGLGAPVLIPEYQGMGRDIDLAQAVTAGCEFSRSIDLLLRRCIREIEAKHEQQ
jgi:MinD-like ATPase involved in chromosome partitioning or flagellar assembly